MPKKQLLLKSSPQKGCFQASQFPPHKSLPGQSRFTSSTQSGELIDQRSGGEREGGFSDALPLVLIGGGGEPNTS